MPERDAPRTFREVGMMIYEIKDDVNDIKRRMDRNFNILVVSILCPIIVSVILVMIMKS